MLNPKTIRKLQKIYNESKVATIGSEIVCPSCKKKHIKTSYQKIFCGSKKCKDWFWNNTIAERACKKNGYYYSNIAPKIEEADDDDDEYNLADETMCTDFDNQYN